MITSNVGDVKSANKIVKLVSGRNITELNQNDIAFCLKFYYDCIDRMKQGRIICPMIS